MHMIYLHIHFYYFTTLLWLHSESVGFYFGTKVLRNFYFIHVGFEGA